MSAKSKRQRKSFVQLFLAIALLVVGVSTIVNAQGGSFLDLVVSAIGKEYASRLPVPDDAGSSFDDLSFGAVNIATTTGAVGWVPNVGISETTRYGNLGVDNVDSRVVGTFQKDCTDATTTLTFFQNTTGKPIAITDFMFKVTGQPTTTVGVSVGTTTRQFVDNGGSPNPYTALDTIGLTAVMDTFIIPTNTATDTAYFMSNYPGINQQYGFKWVWSGTGAVAPTTIQLEGGATIGGAPPARGLSYTLMQPGDFLVVFATSTVNNLAAATDMSAVTSTNSLFNCSVYGEYTILN